MSEIHPVRVYLDNSDLSRFFKNDEPGPKRVLNELLDLKSSGLAKFYFSYWHVVEFIQPPSPEYVEEHRAKALFLYELCEENALPHLTDVIENRPPLGNRHIWLPTDAIAKLTLDFKSSYLKAVDDRHGLTRRQKRQLRSSSGLRAVRSSAKNLEANIESDFPLTEKFREGQYLTKFIRGEISEKFFIIKLAELFSHPPMFYDSWYDQGEKSSLLHDIVHNLENMLVERLNQAQEHFLKIPAMEEQRRELRSQYKSLEEYIQKLGIGVPESMKQKKRNLDRIKFNVDSIIRNISTPPRMEYLKHYFSRSTKSGQFKRSDLGDLMHLFYTPDVDLIRCDRNMFEKMKNCEDLETSKFVKTLLELPERIRVLSSRGQ